MSAVSEADYSLRVVLIEYLLQIPATDDAAGCVTEQIPWAPNMCRSKVTYLGLAAA